MITHYTETYFNINSYVDTLCGLELSPSIRRWDNSVKVTTNKKSITCDKCLKEIKNDKRRVFRKN